jgi:hypothetical protein
MCVILEVTNCIVGFFIATTTPFIVHRLLEKFIPDNSPTDKSDDKPYEQSDNNHPDMKGRAPI